MVSCAICEMLGKECDFCRMKSQTGNYGGAWSDMRSSLGDRYVQNSGARRLDYLVFDSGNYSDGDAYVPAGSRLKGYSLEDGARYSPAAVGYSPAKTNESSGGDYN